jgi:hypothetical protein
MTAFKPVALAACLTGRGVVFESKSYGEHVFPAVMGVERAAGPIRDRIAKSDDCAGRCRLHIDGLEPPQRSRGHLETHRRFVCTHVARAVRASIRCHRCVSVLTGAHGISTNVEADSEVLLRANSHRD